MKAASPLAVVGCFLLLSAVANAVAIHAESIDWVLATSDRVVIGKVVDFSFVLDEKKEKCETFTIAISKTLKGEAADRVSVVMPSFIDIGYAQQWKEEEISLVFFLRKNNGKRVTVSPEKLPNVLDHSRQEQVSVHRLRPTNHHARSRRDP